MIFARKVWHLLVAIKDGLALLLLLGFFLALYAALTARPSAGAVRDGALLLNLNGSIVEEPETVDPIQRLFADEAPTAQYRARDLARAIRLAAGDARIKAVVLDLSRFTGGGMVSVQEVGAAMDAVRAARKPVLVCAMGYGDDAVMLAAHASEVWVDPIGGAIVAGPGGNGLYYGNLLAKLKVQAHVFRVGTYKSAVEPYIRDGMSPEARAAALALYGAVWDNWKADVARARPKANIALVTTDPVGWVKAADGDMAKAAVNAGLADSIGSRADFGKRVAGIVGEDKTDKRPGAFAHTSLRAWLGANKEAKPGKAIGVITVAGTISDGKAGPGSAGGERIAKLLDEALDKNFAALVVRVDSPGGTITGSEAIRAAIQRHKDKGIPIVVSMANLAASGGYWVSTPADRIFAEPSTITGSIGVFAVIPSFEKTLADWGVNADGVKTTPLSGQPDVAGGLSPEIEAVLQSGVEGSYARFLGLVAKARGKSPAEVDAIAQGRVWDGGTARQLGLVDQFGGLDDALAYAAKAADLKAGDWHAAYLGVETDPYASWIERLTRDDDDTAPAQAHDIVTLVAQGQFDLMGRAVADARRLLGTQGVQAYCLECPVATAPASVRPDDLGTLARVARLLGLV